MGRCGLRTQDMQLDSPTTDRAADRDLVALKTRIHTAVAASSSTVTEVIGVGPIVAAYVVGYSGDMRRFPSAGHYARYNGTAPIEASSEP
jgi:transposase